MTQRDVQRIKPGARRSAHLFIAAMLWSSIGILLMVRGWGWMDPGPGRFFIIPGVLLGTLKSIFILDKTAARSIRRIKEFDDVTCIGAVYSWKTWLLVAVMMFSGMAIRMLIEPGMVIGTLYTAIGWALLFSSRHGWLAWWQWIHHD